MNRRQKRIIATLAIANILIIATLMTLVLPATTNRSRSQSHSNSQQVPLQGQVGCQWQATQLLARAGIGGTVTLTPQGLLHFQLIHSLAPDQAIDEAAQWVWAAFDVALALQESATCAPVFHSQEGQQSAPFTDVEVTILVRDKDQSIAQVMARVSAADLVAFDTGEMSEDEFIAQVRYSTRTLEEP